MDNQGNIMNNLSMKDSSNDLQRKVYVECLQKQLDEIDMMSSIFCNFGEIQIYDPSTISDFNEFIENKLTDLRIKLDFSIFIISNGEKIEILIELPHLYPLMEDADVTIRSSLLSKSRESYVKIKIQNFINTMDKMQTYIYQIIMWIEENLDESLQQDHTVLNSERIENNENLKIYEFERMWIYSHYIKNKSKRPEIIRQAGELDLTGFVRPGKPGVICVEGLKENTQEFWKNFKSMHWQKITLKKIENKSKPFADLVKFRKFQHFKEELFTDIGDEECVKMNMSLFMKYLDIHKCNYVKKDLFGFD